MFAHRAIRLSPRVLFAVSCTATALAATALAAVIGPLSARAQPMRPTRTISGVVTLQDRAGAPRDGVSGAVVYLQGGPADARASALPERASIAMRGREFIPHVQIVRAGGDVAFPNQDPFSHNVFSNTANGSFDLGLYRRGRTRSATFDAPGVHPVYCNIHVRMVSYVVAAPTRFVATVGRDGTFRIADVPPGTYTVHVWHERAPEQQQELIVADSDATVRFTLDARGNPLAQHLNKFGQPYSATRTDRY